MISRRNALEIYQLTGSLEIDGAGNVAFVGVTVGQMRGRHGPLVVMNMSHRESLHTESELLLGYVALCYIESLWENGRQE